MVAHVRPPPCLHSPRPGLQYSSWNLSAAGPCRARVRRTLLRLQHLLPRGGELDERREQREPGPDRRWEGEGAMPRYGYVACCCDHGVGFQGKLAECENIIMVIIARKIFLKLALKALVPHPVIFGFFFALRRCMVLCIIQARHESNASPCRDLRLL